jgi:hypothetical protein
VGFKSGLGFAMLGYCHGRVGRGGNSSSTDTFSRLLASNDSVRRHGPPDSSVVCASLRSSWLDLFSPAVMTAGLEMLENVSVFRRLAGGANSSSNSRTAFSILTSGIVSDFTFGGSALGGLNIGGGLVGAEGTLVIAKAF